MIDPLNDGISSVALVQHSGNDLMAVNAARVSLNAFSPGVITFDPYSLLADNDGLVVHPTPKDAKLLKYLLRQGHWSPFEHSHITLRAKVPLFVRSQIFRHTSFRFNEVSARYTEVSDQFYTPKEFRKQAESNRQASVVADDSLNQEFVHKLYEDSAQLALTTYQWLLRAGVAREQARAILPQSMYTEFLMTASLRSWLHFFDARIHEGAQHETQEVARAMKDLISTLFPSTLSAWDSLKETE
jgi:thymidylate synthase (FAD)